MVPQATTEAMPTLSSGDLASDMWESSHAAWLGRWSAMVEATDVASDIVRYDGQFEVQPAGLICSVLWTFNDERLASVSLRPQEGRVALDLLLVRFGIDLSMLVPAGDGLFSIEMGGTRFEVDRLDGVVSLHEVCA